MSAAVWLNVHERECAAYQYSIGWAVSKSGVLLLSSVVYVLLLLLLARH